MQPRARPVFVGVHRGGRGWLDVTTTVESGNSTTERTNLGLEVGALWAVSACVCSKAALNIAGTNAKKSDGDALHGDLCRGDS